MRSLKTSTAIVAMALAAALSLPTAPATALSPVNTASQFAGLEKSSSPVVKIRQRGGGGRMYWRGGGGGGNRAWRGGGGGGNRAWRGGYHGGHRYANRGYYGGGKHYANRGYYRRGYYGGGPYWGWGGYYDNGYFATGLLGLAAGALIGSALTQPYYYAAPPVRYSYVAWSPEWYSYCASKYRSFNPNTGYYLAYSGKYRFCR